MIIGVAGTIGSGKDSIANYLTSNHHFRRMSFASSLKDAVAVIFGWDREMIEGSTKASREWRENVDQWWADRLNIPNLTPRWVLQQWGTEVIRNSFHDDMWIASLENRLRTTTDNVVITDCRFPNEFKAIKDAGGIVVRVVRGAEPEWYKAAEYYNRGPNGNSRWALSKTALDKYGVHPSEYSHVGIDFDATIDNNGTFDHLNQQINDLVQVHLDAK